MIHILSNRDQRYLIILETLFVYRSKSLSQLADLTGSSKRNIQHDIMSINEFIEPMQINTSQKEGCSLSYPDNISIDYLYSCVLKNSLEFTLLEAVFFEKRERLEDYAELLYISVSTLKRTIKKMNQAVAHLDFQISTLPVQLTGNEASITSTMYMFFSEKYRFDELPFKPIEIKTLDKLIEYTIKQQKRYFNFPDLKMAKTLFLVSIVRLQHGHLGKVPQKLPTSFDISFKDNFFLKQAFKSIFKLELSEATLVRLFYPFITGRFALDYNELLEIIARNEESRETFEQLEVFLDTLSLEFKLPLVNKEKLILELFNVYYLNFGQNYLIYNKKKIFLNSFIENAPYAAEFIVESIQRASKLTEAFNEREVEELAYIFITHWEGFAEVIQQFKPVFKVGIFMDTDVEHSEFVADLFGNFFKHEMVFEVISVPTLAELFEVAQEYAFVVTNMSNFPEKKTPFICIGMVPTWQDYNKIGAAYSLLANSSDGKLKN